jgi:hypothetical protein
MRTAKGPPAGEVVEWLGIVARVSRCGKAAARARGRRVPLATTGAHLQLRAAVPAQWALRRDPNHTHHVLLLLALMQAQAPAPTVEIPRIEAEIVVDGTLDEPAWQAAAVLTNFRQYEPIDGRPAEERTEVLVWYAPDAIHFGIRAFDSEPGAIRATRADRDEVDSEDHVIVYLDTFNDQRRAFFFGANALGVQMDGVRTEGAASAGRIFGGNIDDNPDYVYASAGSITSDGYIVELRVPFKSLRYPGNGPQTWGLQVERKTQRTGYTDTWTDVRRASASFLIQAGRITGLHDLERGVVMEAQPFVTASMNGALDPVSGAFERADAEPEVGVNLRFGFTNMSLDATINPDFSQVEADAAQVTVNERFALFFPEKRPFFLEGIELFATPSQLVYTRRVNDPIAGGKVSGKLGSLGIAHLTAVDEGIDDASDAVFNVTRLRGDFGANSLVGLVLTDRTELDGEVYNRVAAADVRYVFGGLYYAEAQLGSGWTRAADGTVAVGPIWKAELDRTGRRWGFNYQLTGIDDEFESHAGFVNRTGVATGHVFNRLTWYGARGALVETVTSFFGPTRVWAYDRFGRDGAIEGDQNINTTVRLRGGWEVRTRLANGFVQLDPAFYSGLMTPAGTGFTPYTALDEVGGNSAALTIETPTFQRFEATVTAEAGDVAIFPEGAEGWSRAISANLSLRPTNALRGYVTAAYVVIDRSRDGSEFARTVIPRALIEFQPTRSFFMRAVGEYRAERRAALEDARTGAPLYRNGAPVGAQDLNGVRVDLLAAYEPRPGTVAFLGYGATLRDDEAFRFRGVQRTTDGLFLKLAYQFRR